jgi:hypothetical protein
VCVLLEPLADRTVRRPGGLPGESAGHIVTGAVRACLRARYRIARVSLHRAASEVSGDVDVDAVAERVEVDAEPLAGRD